VAIYLEDFSMSDPSLAAEPNVSVFNRRGVGKKAAMLLAATRPAFLSASLLPVLAAAALSWYLHEGTFSFGLVFAALLNIALIHLGANALNDYFDAKNGSDAANKARIFPFTGGSRFIQNGVMSAREVLILGLVLMVLGAIGGALFSWFAGPVLLLIGLAGGVLAALYSMPGGLAPRGFGDLTIAICFGVLPSIGVSYILLGAIPQQAWWLGGITGSFTAAILWINSIPDIDADKQAHKMTLPARLGDKRAGLGLPVLFGIGGLLLVLAPFPVWAKLGLLSLIPALLAVRALGQHKFIPGIPFTLIAHASLCLLLCLGFVLAGGL
jgi:1,4-dihydroxy-2-naphthoate octaprenyltransferase